MKEIEPPPGYELAYSDSKVGFGRNISPLFIDKERRRLAFRVGAEHVNVTGVCHGGALATFADCQVVAIRGFEFDAQTHSPTISLTVDYLAAANLGSLVEMEVTLVRQTRTMLFTQAILMAEGENIARTNGIYRYYSSMPPTR
jgi:uncharacterized protein (TIGR00369 family)